VAERLGRLGVVVQRLAEAQPLAVERYRITARRARANGWTPWAAVADPERVRRVAVATEPGRIEAPAGASW
jgi:hypothetical protein